MRLDLFLRASRLIIRRSLAQKFCDAGLVTVNGAVARSSKEVRPGDQIEIRRGNRLTTVRVSDLPKTKQVSRSDAGNLFETVKEEMIEDNIL